MRNRKLTTVKCNICLLEYLKREDTIKDWSGICFKCSNIKKGANIKGTHRVPLKICKDCGHNSYWIGASRLCRPCRMKNMPKGASHYKWKEDRSMLVKRQERNDSLYKRWRMEVYERDRFQCQLKNEDCEGKIQAHHIELWSKRIDLRYEVLNGITLCKYHHPSTRVEEARLDPLLKNIINNKTKYFGI